MNKKFNFIEKKYIKSELKNLSYFCDNNIFLQIKNLNLIIIKIFYYLKNPSISKFTHHYHLIILLLCNDQ